MGANDGIISMAGLVVGLTSTGTDKENIILGTVSALIAGAISMWAGEYISVSSQSDSEKEDIKREIKSLAENPKEELAELSQAYVEKGLSLELAQEVAKELTKHNALEAHLKEEINYEHDAKANPWQAAFVSFFAFMIGGGIPTIVIFFTDNILAFVYPTTLLALSILGYFSSKMGGVPVLKPLLRIVSMGVFVLALTHYLGTLY